MVIFLAAAVAAGLAAAAPAPLVQEMRAKDQALLDAIAPGDRATWGKMLTSDAVYVDENGAIMRHDEFLKALLPLPAGASGHISIVRYDVQVHGDTALVIHRDDERENYHGQNLHADYLMTETWLKQKGDWRLAMIHAYVVAEDPPAVAMAPAALNEYAGRYSAAPDLIFVIHRDGDHLMGGREGREPRNLLAESPDVFFIAGEPRSRKIFRRDAQHRIIDFTDRREGEDLIYKRSPK